MSIRASNAPIPTGLPVVNQTFEPAWVREGSPATKKAYALAQGFEEMLVQELSQSMAKMSGLGEEQASLAGGSGESEEAPVAGAAPMASELSSLLPQALSSGILAAGGLGVAAQLTRELGPPSSPAQAQVGESGGTGT